MPQPTPPSAFTPLRHPAFRLLWLANRPATPACGCRTPAPAG
ncbi:hypothetical protein [Teichococcus aestuarii]